jgi:hypothetical protein
MQIVASIQFLEPRAFPIENGTAGVALATIFTAASDTGIEHDRVNNVAIVQILARYVVNMVDVDLLQPTRRAEATLRGSTGIDHRQELVIHWIIHWIAPDRVHQNRRGWKRDSPAFKASRLRLARHCHSWEAVPDAVLQWT